MQGYNPHLTRLNQLDRTGVLARYLDKTGASELPRLAHAAATSMNTDQLKAALLPPRKTRR